MSSPQNKPTNYTQNFFRNCIKSTRNQIVFTIFRLIFEQQTDSVRLLIQINRIMVNTIRFGFDLIRFRKDFSVCTQRSGLRLFETSAWQRHGAK